MLTSNQDGETLLQGGGDQPRMAECPHCHRDLDVCCFDPLERVQCGGCSMYFEVLKEFGKYTLLKSYDAGWQNAVYLAQDKRSKELTIIKLLSSHVLGQSQALEDFQREADQIREVSDISLVKGYSSGVQNGFPYIAIELSAGVTNEEAQQTAQMIVLPDQSETQSFSFTPPKVMRERTSACPHCKFQVNVTSYNPLERVKCSQCKESFELLRQFADYKIESRLNEGGSSVLYTAYSRKFKRDVALKVLSASEMKNSRESLDRFLRESDLTQQLRHPNIIQVYESGDFRGFYYISMELLEGMTLDDIMDYIQKSSLTEEGQESWGSTTRSGKSLPGLPELICLEIMLQAAAGLGDAHRHGLVHGDIKPANIMVTYEGIVKVLDFGLAQFSNAEKLIAEGEQFSIQGTPLYLPPERVRGEPEDFRSDLYGLGASLYHMLRGIAPFRAKTPSEVALMHAQSPLLVFSAVAPWVSEATCRVVDQSMKKIVDERYNSHVAFIADLTLAKNQILNQMDKKPRDGRSILKNFMKSFPSRQEGLGLWKQTGTTAIRTYRPSSSIRKKFSFNFF